MNVIRLYAGSGLPAQPHCKEHVMADIETTCTWAGEQVAVSADDCAIMSLAVSWYVRADSVCSSEPCLALPDLQEDC